MTHTYVSPPQTKLVLAKKEVEKCAINDKQVCGCVFCCYPHKCNCFLQAILARLWFPDFPDPFYMDHNPSTFR